MREKLTQRAESACARLTAAVSPVRVRKCAAAGVCPSCDVTVTTPCRVDRPPCPWRVTLAWDAPEWKWTREWE